MKIADLKRLLPSQSTTEDRARAARQRQTGLISTSITLIVVVGLILINVVAGALADRYPMSIDLTSDKLFQLSDVSIDYVEALQKDVRIIVAADEATFSGGDQYYKQAYEVIKKYAQYSDHITLQFVDLAVNPTFASQYTDETLSVGDILVVCGDSVQVLTAYDLFDIEFSWTTFGSSITASKAEQAMTGAIVNVTSDVKPLVAFVTGHGETDATGLKDSLTKNGFETSDFSPLTEDVPAAAEAVVLVAPLYDLSEAEVTKLTTYLENGGAYGRYLIYYASLSQGTLPYIEAMLKTWGLSVDAGAVVETRANRVMSQNAYYGIADLVDTTLTGKMSDTSIALIMPLTRPLSQLFTSSMGYATDVLLQYSESAGIADENTTQMSDVVVSGPIAVGVRSTYQGSSILVYGSEYLVDSTLLQSPSVSNESYILSVFNTLCARENAISIPSKTLGGSTFMLAQSQVMLFGALFVVVLPLATLAVGLTIWARRRRR